MTKAARRAQARAMGFQGDFGGGNYQKWWQGLSKAQQQQKTRANPLSNFQGGEKPAQSSGGSSSRSFGDKVQKNKYIAEQVGYEGDFGDGQFVKFFQNNPGKQTQIADVMRDNPYRDYGNNPERNQALAEKFPGFVGDFGDRQFQKFYTGSSSTKKEQVDEYLEEEWNWDAVLAANKTGTPNDQKGNPKPKSKSGAKPLSGNNKLNPGASGGVRRRRLLG